MVYVRNVSPCYNVHVENRGVAYQLWAAVNDAQLTRGWSGVKMAATLGVSRNTISNLKTSPAGPEPGTVHKVADGLKKLGVDITRREAEVLAGLRPPEPTHSGYVSAVAAIKADLTYTEVQRAAMLEMAEIFARTNQAALAALEDDSDKE